MTIYQISVFLENRAGQLAEITSTLAEHGVDLRAINIAETLDYGVLRVIADDPRRAAAILSEQGYVVHPTPVVAAAVPDQPGGLNKVLCVLAKENIDIEYMYSVFGQSDGMAYMIFRVQDPEHLAEVLTGNGIKVPDGPEMGIRM